jgi:cytoskeletal protein RodZ
MTWTATDIDDDSYNSEEPYNDEYGEGYADEAYHDHYDEVYHEANDDVDESSYLPAMMPVVARPRWTPQRLIWLMIVLIFIAMLVVYMVLPWLQWLLRPEASPPLVPPVNL